MHPRAKNYLIILLAFATATAGTIAWQQHQQLKALQSDLLTARRVPARKITAPKPPVTGDTATVAAAPKPADEEAAPPADAAAPARPQRNNNRGNFTALMNNPEAVKAWNLQQRSQLDGRFAALFKQLNLSPVQLENFKNLLVDRQSTAMEIYATARDKGLDPNANRDEIRKLVTESQGEVDQSIKAALGETGYQQYQNYENTQAQRAVVSQLDQRLSYSATPLTSSQSQFLVQALSVPATGTTAVDQNGGGTGGSPWGGNRGGVTITDAVIKQAQNVLVPDQVAALKQIQAEQQAQQKLGQLLRGAGSIGGGRQRGN